MIQGIVYYVNIFAQFNQCNSIYRSLKADVWLCLFCQASFFPFLFTTTDCPYWELGVLQKAGRGAKERQGESRRSPVHFWPTLPPTSSPRRRRAEKPHPAPAMRSRLIMRALRTPGRHTALSGERRHTWYVKGLWQHEQAALPVAAFLSQPRAS